MEYWLYVNGRLINICCNDAVYQVNYKYLCEFYGKENIKVIKNIPFGRKREIYKYTIGKLC